MATPVSIAEFRSRKSKPVAPPPAATTALPGPGRMPLKAGTVVRLTDDEKADLTKLGWQEGDPVPSNLADLVAEMVAESTDVGHLLPVAPDTPPLVVPEASPIDRLSPAKRQELTAAMAEMKARAQSGEPAGPIPAAGPGVNEALAVATAAEAAAAARPVPPRRPPPAPPTPPTPADTAEVVALRAQVAELQNAVNELTSDPDRAGLLARPNCPHCGWDQERNDELTVTDHDKYAYLAMVLGGADCRFHRTTTVFAGAVTVNFRTLLHTEVNRIFEQVGTDLRSGRCGPGDGEYLRAIQDYRMAATVERVSLRGGGDFAIPVVADFPAADGDPTPLPVMLAYLNEQLLPSENLRRAVQSDFFRFQRLVEKMEVNAQNEGFWRGIDAQP